MALPVKELLPKAADELGAKGDPSSCPGHDANLQNLSSMGREGSW